MLYGICPLSVVCVRTAPDDSGETITQLLYGDCFKVPEKRSKWSKIRNAYDSKEGWVPNGQYKEITADQYETLKAVESTHSIDLVAHILKGEHQLIPVVIGSNIKATALLGHEFEGSTIEGSKEKSKLVETALLYLNAPYQKGGKTPFGIDSSGFVQMVYKINGFDLNRSAEEQSKQGMALSFIEESEPGDLAFFDTKEGVIDHVGIILKDNYIIHVNGHVRIDRLDHTGIFNPEEKVYTHQLRVIKKMA